MSDISLFLFEAKAKLEANISAVIGRVGEETA